MQMDDPQFTWTYIGGDKQYCGTTFTCAPRTSLLDDICIEKIQSHVFFLRMIEKGDLHGFYYAQEDGVEKQITHVRSPGHVRPTDDYLKAHGLLASGSKEIEDPTPNSEPPVPDHPPPPQENASGSKEIEDPTPTITVIHGRSIGHVSLCLTVSQIESILVTLKHIMA